MNEELAKEHNEEEITLALELKDDERINDIIDSMHPIDLAIQMEEFTDDKLLTLYDVASDEQVASILEQADEDLQVRMILLMDNARVIRLFGYMSKDDIVDILGELPLNRSKEIINLMKAGERKIIQQLLGYREDTAGGIMTTEYIALYGKLSINAALNKIKEIGPKTEVIETIFVINEKKQLLEIGRAHV